MSERILVIRLSALGDIIVTLPVIGALRRGRPGVALDWLVDDRFAALLAEVEGIDRILTFPRRAATRPGGWPALIRHLAHLHSQRYEAVLDMQGNLKSAAQVRLTRAARKIGLDRGSAREGAHHAVDIRVELPARCHRVERALALLRPLDIDCSRAWQDGAIDRDLRPAFRQHPGLDAKATQALAVVSGPGPLVAMHPGTSAYGAFKRLPPTTFGAVAAQLHASLGARVVVTHGPGEEDLADRVVTASAGTAHAVPPTGGIAGLIALLRRVDLLVAADSGPLLLASALGIPTVALFGPKDPDVYAPPFGNCRVVRTAVPCSPCSLRRCPDPICMTTMSADAIVVAATELLAGDPAISAS